MKILNYVELIDSVRSNRTELYTKKHKNNQKIRKSSGTVRRDKIELVRLSSVRFDSVRFENLLKFDSFTVTQQKPIKKFFIVN
jgi:Asp-tRNA(Asn)/Glu-tRNA(Gln) amidotransferase C subunit